MMNDIKRKPSEMSNTKINTFSYMELVTYKGGSVPDMLCKVLHTG